MATIQPIGALIPLLLLASCGSAAAPGGGINGEPLVSPPFTLDSTSSTSEAPAADLTIGLRTESGFRATAIVKQQTDWASDLPTAKAYRGPDGVALRAWSVQEIDGSATAFRAIGTAGSMIGTICSESGAPIQVRLDGPRESVDAAVKSVSTVACPSEGLAGLDDVLGSEWNPVGGVGGRTPAPFGRSWATTYSDESGHTTILVAYSLQDPKLSLEAAALIFPYDFGQVDGNAVIHRSAGGGMSETYLSVVAPGYLVQIESDASEKGLAAVLDAFEVVPVRDLFAAAHDR